MMKYYNVKATTELYNTHLRHCLRVVLRVDNYDNFFSALLSEMGDLKYIMKDVHESKINPVKMNSFLAYIDPTQCVDMEMLQSVYFGLVLSNRNYKNYRKIIEKCAIEYLNSDISTFKKSLSIVIKYAQNEVNIDDCLDYVMHFAFGSEINLKSEMPRVALSSHDKPTQLVFNVINHALLKDNYYPLGINEFIQMYDYLYSLTDLYIYTSYNSIDTEPYKSERFDDIPMSLVHIADFEKSIIDRTFVTEIRASLAGVTYEEAIGLQRLIRNLKSALITSFEDTCRLFTYTYTLSDDELSQLSRAFSINPMTFTYLALLKHKHTESKNNAQITMSIHNCVDLLKQSAISQFGMTEHLITIYESDILIKQLCASVCDSSDLNVKELNATHINSIESKDSQILKLSKDLSEAKTKISNFTTKEISQKETVDALKKEILLLNSKILQLEDERDFYKAIAESEFINGEEELKLGSTSLFTLECLDDVLSQYPDLKIAVITRNSSILAHYNNFDNIKVVNAWSCQFDTRPIKEADIVVVNTLQLDHAITYRVKSAISRKSKLFFTKNSNLTILNNYLIGLIKTHGGTAE